MTVIQMIHARFTWCCNYNTALHCTVPLGIKKLLLPSTIVDTTSNQYN